MGQETVAVAAWAQNSGLRMLLFIVELSISFCNSYTTGNITFSVWGGAGKGLSVLKSSNLRALS